tara:strand:+ start:6856 stop:7455 length:600 start_codon:yes stop_codon:yes gene_type:complete
MKKTPQEFRREEVKKLFEKVLGNQKTNLVPLSITVSESLNDDFTTTDFSFEDQSSDGIVTVNDSKGKGFIDGLFIGLHRHYLNNFPSLKNIRLVDMIVNPLMKNNRGLGSEAKTDVIFRVEIDGHGIAEFQNTSRSMIYSGFVASLQAFQFYINCEKTFDRINFAVIDATSRNRGDILQSCLTDLSKLTEVNSYERKIT